MSELLQIIQKLLKSSPTAARRLERAADEVPGLEKQFAPDVLRDAALDQNSRLSVIDPSKFENYAARLSNGEYKDTARKIYDATNGEPRYTDLPSLDLRRAGPARGMFDETPPVGDYPYPAIVGHEGRHRMRQIARGSDKSLMTMTPKYDDLKKVIGSQNVYDDRTAAVQKYFENQQRIIPEKYRTHFERSIDDDMKRIFSEEMPEHFGDGGTAAVLPALNAPAEDGMADGGLTKRGINAIAKFMERSKVRHPETGEPVRAYHITKENFDSFKPGGTDPELSGPATWLSLDPEYLPAAHNVGGFKDNAGVRQYKEGTNVMPVWADLRNPLHLDKDTLEWARKVYGEPELPYRLSPASRAKMIEDGHDSIFGYDLETGKISEVLSLHPERQLKSAISNSGEYDPSIPSIHRASGGLAGYADGAHISEAEMERMRARALANRRGAPDLVSMPKIDPTLMGGLRRFVDDIPALADAAIPTARMMGNYASDFAGSLADDATEWGREQADQFNEDPWGYTKHAVPHVLDAVAPLAVATPYLPAKALGGAWMGYRGIEEGKSIPRIAGDIAGSALTGPMVSTMAKQIALPELADAALGIREAKAGALGDVAKRGMGSIARAAAKAANEAEVAAKPMSRGTALEPRKTIEELQDIVHNTPESSLHNQLARGLISKKSTGTVTPPYATRVMHPDEMERLRQKLIVTPDARYMEAPTADIAQLQGGTLMGLPQDRTGIGNLHAVDGKALSRPIHLGGGAMYPTGQGNGAGASGQGVVTTMADQMKKASSDGPVFTVHIPMAGGSSDSARMTSDTFFDLLDRGAISKKDAKIFDNKLRSTIENGKTPYDDFPGLNSETFEEWMKIGGHRRAFMKIADQDGMAEMGLPSLSAIRHAIQDPLQRGLPGATGANNYEVYGGQMISRLDPRNIQTPTKNLPIPHETYPIDIAHAGVMGGLETPVPRSVLFRDFYKQRRLEGKPQKSDERAFNLPPPQLQRVDQQLVDEVSKYIEDQRKLGDVRPLLRQYADGGPARELPADTLERLRKTYRQPGTSFTSENYREPMAVVNTKPDSRPQGTLARIEAMLGAAR